MKDAPYNPFRKNIDCINDPRKHNIRHLLHDMLLITLCAIISGAEAWTHVAEYGRSKEEWFRQFLQLPNGIPSHDTFGRLFAMLNPKDFQEFFTRWVGDLSASLKGKTISIDGKTLRRSHDNTNWKAAIHMVSAWVADIGMVLGQIKTDDKSNEITAIPELLSLLKIDGCVITIDAMGCQKEIVSKIREKGADYVIALKGNQGVLKEQVSYFLEEERKDKFKGTPHDFYKCIDGDHGRVESRKYWITDHVDWIFGRTDWQDLRSIGMVESTRETAEGKHKETRYYISSLAADAKEFSQAVRGHWGIENSVHWTLDVAFNEDQSRIRRINADENYSKLRRIALNLLKNEKTAKVGVKAKRHKCGWDNKYLLKVLFG